MALYPGTSDLTTNLEDALLCRICLGDDETSELIAPCSCRGSSRWVHRFCLDEWRAQERVTLAFSHCSVCRDAYDFEPEQSQSGAIVRQRMCFGLHVTRDIFIFFIFVQGTIAGLGFIMHAWDRAAAHCKGPWSQPCDTWITSHFATEWARSASVSRLRPGPYYVSSAVVLLAFLGLVGLVLACAGKLPRAPSPASSPGYRQSARLGKAPTEAPVSETHQAHGIRRGGRRRRQRAYNDRVDCGTCCDCCDRTTYYCWLYNNHDNNGDCSECCAACLRCEGCQQCTAGSGNGGGNDGGNSEGGGAILGALVAVVIVFAIIGVVVGVFFVTVLVQRIVQRHIHLLHMRTVVKRHVVKDLATAEERALMMERANDGAAAAAGASSLPAVEPLAVVVEDR